MGVSERWRGGRTCYNATVAYDKDGTLLGVHRKILPTFAERYVWGRGDGSGLIAWDSSSARIGSLICWEHTMNLARYISHDCISHSNQDIVSFACLAATGCTVANGLSAHTSLTSNSLVHFCRSFVTFVCVLEVAQFALCLSPDRLTIACVGFLAIWVLHRCICEG